jgi:RNA polymerase sigma factor (TIGR02999 family)
MPKPNSETNAPDSSSAFPPGFEADPRAIAELVVELRVLAQAARRRISVGQTLATTALVHEAYLKLSRSTSAQPTNRKHFFALAARAMREILIDAARARKQMLPLDANRDEVKDVLPSDVDIDQMLAIDQALQQLAQIQPRLADVTLYRYFAGYSELEIAELLDVDERTVQRDWQRARALLQQLLQTSQINS